MPIKLLKKLKRNKFEIDVYDPIVNKKELIAFEKIKTKSVMKKKYYDLVLIVVPHKKIIKLGNNWIINLLNSKGIVFDLKSKFPLIKSEFSL